MAIAHVASTGAGGGSSTTATTVSIDTTGADLIVLVGVWEGIFTPTFSDNKSNTWNTRPTTQANGVDHELAWCNPTSVGTGHTFTLTLSGGGFPGIGVVAVSGADQSAPFDTESFNLTGSQSTVQPGSITPSVDGCLLVSGSQFLGNIADKSIDSGFTKNGGDQATGYGVGASYLIQGTAAAINPTWSGGSLYAASIIAFKPATGGGGNTRRYSLTTVGVG